MRKVFTAAVLFLLILSISTSADEFKNTVHVRLVSNVSSVKAGETFLVGVLYEIRPDWHIYWKNPGDSGLPTTLSLDLPDGYTAGDLKWPVPEKFISNEINLNYGYKESLLLWKEVKAPDNISRIMPVEIKAKTTWVSCREICIQGESDLNLKMNSFYAFTGNERELFKNWEDTLPLQNRNLEKFLSYREELNKDGENKHHKITIDWKTDVPDFEFFPDPENSINLENINLSHNKLDNTSEITFTSSLYDGQQVQQSKLGSVLVLIDSEGNRLGIEFPLKI